MSYSHEDLEKIVRDISKIKSQKNLEKVKDIIISNNPELKVTENSNGIFMHFNNLNNSTYVELENFINQLKAAKNPTQSEKLSETQMSESKPHDEFSINYNNSKLKFSNREKTIIKRKHYNNALIKHSEDVDKDLYSFSENTEDVDDNLFIKTK